jgi:large conductance mechanosensitive channel
MVKGFRAFLMRGNVVDLAVAVVVGAAFGAVVAAFSVDIIGAIGGTPDFGNAGFTVNDSKIVYGSTINALINFAIVAAVIYFIVVVPMTTLATRFKDADAATPAPTDEAVLLTEIRDLLAAERSWPG